MDSVILAIAIARVMGLFSMFSFFFFKYTHSDPYGSECSDSPSFLEIQGDSEDTSVRNTKNQCPVSVHFLHQGLIIHMIPT